MTDTVSFTVTPDEHKIIMAIAKRAQGIEGLYGNIMHVSMNISACHANGCPLDLQRLLDADDFNFCHDVAGIDRHINRDNGQLENFFLPRFALPEKEDVR